MAIGLEITAVRIGDSLVRCTGGVFVDDVNFAASAELLHLLQMARRHNENEIGLGNDCGREFSRAMPGEIDLPLHANEQRLVGRGNVIPGVGPCARDVEILNAATLGDFSRQCFGHRTAARVTTTDEQKIHFLRVTDQIRYTLSQFGGRDRTGTNYARQSSGAIDNS